MFQVVTEWWLAFLGSDFVQYISCTLKLYKYLLLNCTKQRFYLKTNYISTFRSSANLNFDLVLVYILGILLSAAIFTTSRFTVDSLLAKELFAGIYT